MTSTISRSANAKSLLAALSSVDFTPIVRTLQAEEGMDEDGARRLIPAFLQWFSLVPTLVTGDVYVCSKRTWTRYFMRWS
jgi:hypothetical protein